VRARLKSIGSQRRTAPGYVVHSFPPEYGADGGQRRYDDAQRAGARLARPTPSARAPPRGTARRGPGGDVEQTPQGRVGRGAGGVWRGRAQPLDVGGFPVEAHPRPRSHTPVAGNGPSARRGHGGHHGREGG
jgi:hypothetical protein